ncbi:MAG: Clp protease ClpP [Clostridium sp.]|nr:Clp protease ClpP [Clostridium sp.]
MKKYFDLSVNEPEESGEQSADLYLFGEITDPSWKAMKERLEIDDGSASGLSIAKTIRELPEGVSQLKVHINSPGGDAYEGLAIYNILRNCGREVETFCEGLAASAASVIFMAGSKRVMSDASLLMLHNPWTSLSGNAANMREEAEILDKISSAMAAAYTSGGAEEAEILGLMDGENHSGTWLTAEEAVQYHLATSIEKGAQEQAKAVAQLGRKQAVVKVTLDDAKMKEIVQKTLERMNLVPKGSEGKELTLADKIFSMKGKVE